LLWLCFCHITAGAGEGVGDGAQLVGEGMEVDS
jgi:hypothetical protein